MEPNTPKGYCTRHLYRQGLVGAAAQKMSDCQRGDDANPAPVGAEVTDQ
jgi:hypothetical protein